MSEIVFTVGGIPAPKGSTRSFAFKRRDGRLGTSTVADCERLRDWAASVRLAAQDAMAGRELLDGPVHVELAFWLLRPKSVSERKRPLPVTKPDLDKLVRGALDAMTAIVWRDDAQVVLITAGKNYEASPGLRARVWQPGGER